MKWRMSLRRFAFPKLTGRLTACLFVMGASPVVAQDSCQTMGHTIESIAIVQALSATPDADGLSARLDRVAQRLRTNNLSPNDANALSVDEQKALQLYMTAIQQAAALAETGSVDDARAVVAPFVTADLFSSISNLQERAECLPEGSAEVGDDEVAEIGGNATLAGESSGRGAGEPGNLAKGSNSGPGTEAVEAGQGRGAYFGRDAIASGSMVTFYIMLLLFALAGLGFYLQRRLRRETEREARRILDKPVKVYINGALLRLHLIDISMNGAKLGHAGEVTENDDIGIDIGGTWHNAQVRWTNSNYAGVKFKKALDAFTVEQMS